MRTKKQGKGWRIFGIVMACLLIIVTICAGITAVSSKANIKYASEIAQVVIPNALEKPTLDEDGYWSFRCDREFRVMQLTDVHIGGGFMSLQKDNWAINAVADLIKANKPDLVIVTGDIGYPVPFQAGTFNNMTPVKEFSTLMESLGVYWTFVYGNHDTEVYSYYDRKGINDYYVEQIEKGNLKYCLYREGFSGEQEGYEKGESDAGYGNQVINVSNTAGDIVQSLFLFDSHSYEKGFYQDYDHMHQCQIDWYKKTVTALNEKNNKHLGVVDGSMTVKSLAFYHIPSEEYLTAFTEWDAEQKDTANVKMVYGKMGESRSGKMVYCGIASDNLFETMMELGSTKGIFCGHDHYNNFSLFYNGGSGDNYIRLTYGMSIDYLAYIGIAKETAQRGCTMITVQNDGSFDCYGYRLVDGAKID